MEEGEKSLEREERSCDRNGHEALIEIGRIMSEDEIEDIEVEIWGKENVN